MLYITSSTSINFANVTTNYAANTLKLNVRIANWPFLTIANSLAIVFDAKNTDVKTESCNLNNHDVNTDLQWFVVSINGTSMYLSLLQLSLRFDSDFDFIFDFAFRL